VACASTSSETRSSISTPTNDNNWVELDRFDLEYDSYAGLISQMLYTTLEDNKMMQDIFFGYLKNAHLARVTSEVYLDNNYNHQLIVYRRWVESDYVSFYIYRLTIVYRNCSIEYDFISDKTIGAADFGERNGFINFYTRSLDAFTVNVDAEMRKILNQLSRSDDEFVLMQASAIRNLLNNKTAPLFFF
jgi:hypothetical protein